MKKLIYFLLFSTVGFAQNYQYALGEATAKTVVAPQGVNNQPEEIEYFKAYLLPIEKKATLQQALDTYGAVRLEKGDYSGIPITLHSNQKLYGHPSISGVPSITIAAGSSNVVLEYLKPLQNSDLQITFQSGSIISNCTIKTIKYGSISVVNAKLENNNFIDISGQIKIDCSSSGYFRNTKIIKHQAQTNVLNLVMKGNNITPSYGNVNLHSNYLTPSGDATDIDGLQTATFVGIDSEGWNLTGAGTKAMFTAKNIGNLKITDLGGDNGYSQVRTGAYDISANKLFVFNRNIGSNDLSTVSLSTNLLEVAVAERSTRPTGTVTGYDIKAHISRDNQKNISYNGASLISTITGSSTISVMSSAILGNQNTPWDRSTFETLPNPLGFNWSTERLGKTDSRAYIQNLIDTNGIAELPEGVFYISSTLKIPLDNNHGIVGKGTGKTVIVGLTDNFPLITLGYGSTANFTLSYLTLQGGSVGIYSGIENTQIAYQNLKYVIFRNQNYGIQLTKITGLDNNFFEHLAFVNCKKGFFSDPAPSYIELSTSSYTDKTMFYKSQFIDCIESISMITTRANNLNAWVDCSFDGGNIAFNLSSQNFPIIANCEFKRFSGSHVINSNTISIYNSNFFNNTVTESIIKSSLVYIEGSNLLDSQDAFSPVQFNYTNQYVLNSTINGKVIQTIPLNQGFYPQSAVFMNSNLVANPSLSKLLVNLKDNISTVLINQVPNPYPQFLVTQ